MATIQQMQQVRKAIAKYGFTQKLQFRASNCGNTVIIEPSTHGRNDMEGLQILWFVDESIIEFSEYMAGPKQNELHVFGEYKTLNAAFARLLKGKKQPVKIWN